MRDDVKAFYEKLNASLMYLNKLEDGKHPNSDKELFDPAEQANSGIVNCIGFVKSVLENVRANPSAFIDSGKNIPFYVTEKIKSQIPTTNELLTVKRLTEVINEYAGEPGMERLRGRTITGWLMKNGYLKSEMIHGSPYRVPAEKAEEIGISICQYKKGNMEYPLNLYNKDAQQFIIDHLDDIINDVILEENDGTKED